MSEFRAPTFRPRLFILLLLSLFLGACGGGRLADQPHARDSAVIAQRPTSPSQATPAQPLAGPKVQLGIDVLEQQDFECLRNRRVGLLTHAAGVNRFGIPSIEVLRRSSKVSLVALYAVEHGLYSELGAEKPYPDHRDSRTGLPVYSLYNGKSRYPSPAQLEPIDVLVIDLQDIGTRSYTYVSAMRYAMEACFKQGKEVVVLDRPNPLGGLKIDGPFLDEQWMSYVGAFRVPYVHGMTIGELAHMSKELPGILKISDKQRMEGKLTVIPMRGWTRTMRWPETGLRWVPTSPMIPDFAAVLGYPMTGLGCYLGGFRHGIGKNYPFRGISHKQLKPEQLVRELNACGIRGVRFRLVNTLNGQGKSVPGVYADIVDWNAWRPTELSLQLMRLACRIETKNPFSTAKQGDLNGFLRHVGSTELVDALRKDGARINLERFQRNFDQQCLNYRNVARKYWLYY